MKLIASVKNFFVCSLLLLIAACGLVLTPAKAFAISADLGNGQYLAFTTTSTSTTTAPAIVDNKPMTIDDQIKALREEKVAIGKDTALTIDEKKDALYQINSAINNLLLDKNKPLDTQDKPLKPKKVIGEK